MQTVVCPHCKTNRIFTSRIPKDVIVVMPCPACHEWVVLFWNRVLAVSRKILKHGTFEERKSHIASVIAEFFEQGVQQGDEDEGPMTDFPGLRNAAFHMFAQDPMQRSTPAAPPISQDEVDRFIKRDLQRIDDPQYFKKHIG